MRARLPRLVVGLALAAALFLGGCTGPSDDSEAASGDGTGTSTAGGGPSPHLPVPNGVVLTDQGSELGLGESAVVAWRPKQGEVGVLKVTVRKLERAPIKALLDWQLDAAGRKSSLFYVTVTVENAGELDLRGRRIPLYVADGRNSLIESNAFKTEYQPCPSPALPEPFASGEETTACLVYLVPDHGRLTSVTFRPGEKFNPITWVGKVVQPKKPKKPKAEG
jgi:hypothetical protein